MNHSLPITDGPHDQPPVYDCRVVLTLPSGDEFNYRAFAGNLPHIEATGPTERDCLRDLVNRFKEALQNIARPRSRFRGPIHQSLPHQSSSKDGFPSISSSLGIFPH